MEHNTTQLKKFTPETMKEIVYVTWPTLAPAGNKVAWVDWKGDMKSGLFSSKIHLMENYHKCDRRAAEGRGSKRICFDTRWHKREAAIFSFRWHSYGISVE